MNTLSIIHDYLQRNVKPGDFCIDATAGKGRDTALLCKLCGSTGRVISFDIQKEALRQTKDLLMREHVDAELILDSHSNMENYADKNTVDYVVFNLGRLPGGDVHIFTKAQTTIPAIVSALNVIKPGGYVVIALYYGGANGYDERDSVIDFVSKLDCKSYSVFIGNWANRQNDPPIPIFIRKETDG